MNIPHPPRAVSVVKADRDAMSSPASGGTPSAKSASQAGDL
jgi:hypothetical protein